MGSYIPHTAEQREQMLALIGVKSLDDLYKSVPHDMLIGDKLALPDGMSELEVREKVTAMAEKNKVFKTVLRGAGAYRHFIPAVVKSITSREELVTCYTPYQAEISQGVLQGVFEFQTMICELTGMDVSNASHYDGATAAAETIPMCKDRKRTRAYVSATVNPQVIETMQTYCFASNTELIVVPARDGKTDAEALKQALGADAACFYLQQPNYYGLMEDAAALGEITHAAGAKFVMGVNPIACAVMKTPRECGADIVVADGQPLGLDTNFGGPYLGIMATTNAMTRKLPGRIVGETHDVDGERGYVLTLSAREQHIRREKATSNICTAQGIMCFYVAAYLSLMGAKGLSEVAEQSYAAAHALVDALLQTGQFEMSFPDRPYFCECTLRYKGAEGVKALRHRMAEAGFLFGVPAGDDDTLVTVCATEMRTPQEVERLIQALSNR